MQLRRLGPRAVLIEVADPTQARQLADWLRHAVAGCREVVPAATTVLVDGLADLDGLAALLREFSASQGPAQESQGLTASSPLVTIPVTYGGPDLAEIAIAWGVGPDEVVRRHTSLAFVSAFCGFSPGFSYLEGLPEGWEVPRLRTPRTRVPVGSVAMADRWCAVYPSASPGGWRILGSTTAQMWDQAAAQPALLPPGTPVRFVAA